MTKFEWKIQESGLGLREDASSWQGCYKEDPRFFLRRSKYDPEELSDLLFGDLIDDQIEKLLAEFMTATGGISGDRIVFTAISDQENEHSRTVAVFDRIAKIGRNVAVMLGRQVKNAILDQDGSKWNAILKLEPKKSLEGGVIRLV